VQHSLLDIVLSLFSPTTCSTFIPGHLQVDIFKPIFVTLVTNICVYASCTVVYIIKLLALKSIQFIDVVKIYYPRYSSDRRLGGAQNRSGRCGESNPGRPARTWYLQENNSSPSRSPYAKCRFSRKREGRA
jgi:hypothetical protein